MALISSEETSSNNHSSRNNRSSGGSNSVVDSYRESGDTLEVKGILDIQKDGYGVLRSPNLKPSSNDVYVSSSQIRRFGIRMGDMVSGVARPPKEGERYYSLLRIDKVAGEDPEKASDRPNFDKLTPIFPREWLKLETDSNKLSTRVIDLVSPIGKGQRGAVVSPPYAGKTWLLKDIANGVTENHSEIELVVLLIAERPEEVTDMRRSVNGEVIAANFDEPPDVHTQVAELTLEMAKRRAELGNDVVILLDSITRLARAYNLVIPPSGRTLTGGFDPAALYPPKHFFGAARNFEDGGSLTIMATALVDTGSRMDDLIYEEFKGTGNMELFLDRSLAERRIFPAIDIKRSYTRHEELLYGDGTLEKAHRLRRMIDLLSDDEATPLILERLKKTETNKEFLDTLHEKK